MRTAHALTLSTVASIFMICDASNAGLFQKFKLQTLEIMSKYCWADVQSFERADVEWEYWPDVDLVKDGTGRGCLAVVSKQ